MGRRPIHPFPARMAAGIALDVMAASNTPLRVLDPMAGSGTVLAVAREQGHRAFGVDVDPLAVVISRVWTSNLNAAETVDQGRAVLREARERFLTIRASEAYPDGSDAETRQFIRYWFDDYARRQLYALSLSIGAVTNVAIRDALWCAFSRLIITKSAGASLAMDLAHSRPHRKYDRAPAKPFSHFEKAVSVVAENCSTNADKVGPPVDVCLGDARHLELGDDSIDLVVTSPPYLNGIDYLRCSKFSLVWMGYTVAYLRGIRGESVGAESGYRDDEGRKFTAQTLRDLKLGSSLSPRKAAILGRYALDMHRAVAEVGRVLVPGGRAVYVIGESKNSGVYIRNSAIIRSAGLAAGLEFVTSNSRNLPPNRRYMPPPRKSDAGGMDARLRRELVIVLRKPAA